MDEDYQEKEKILSLLREKAAQVFGSKEAVEAWLETPADSYWHMSPLEALRAGHGRELLDILEARISTASKTKADSQEPVITWDFKDKSQP